MEFIVEYVTDLSLTASSLLGVSVETALVLSLMALSYSVLGTVGLCRLLLRSFRKPLTKTPPAAIETPAEIPERASEIEAVLQTEVPEPLEPLQKKLSNTRNSIFGKLQALLGIAPRVTEDLLEEAEYLLVSADIGTTVTRRVIDDVKGRLGRGDEVVPSTFYALLKERIQEILTRDVPPFGLEAAPDVEPRGGSNPTVLMMVGVNGVGKTTTCAKLAARYSEQGKKVLLVAGDTFRAAAVDQLKLWGERLGVAVFSGREDAKPSSVVFDAMVTAKSEGFDLVIVDTAGRLHTKTSLMQELEGMKNAMARHIPEAPHVVLLVVDGSTGQNALAQAKEFHEAVELNGVIVTKLDGTPKGGIVVAIKEELGIPVRFIGVGESQRDLRPFVAEEFVEALFSTEAPNALETVSAHGETRRRKRRAA